MRFYGPWDKTCGPFMLFKVLYNDKIQYIETRFQVLRYDVWMPETVKARQEELLNIYLIFILTIGIYDDW